MTYGSTLNTITKGKELKMYNMNAFSVTTSFIAPMVFKDNVNYSKLSVSIYNTYLSIFDKPEYDDKIIIEVRNNLSLNLCKPNLYITATRYDKSVLYIFNIPKEYEEDLYLAIGGRYSKLSEEYKRKLLYFWAADKDSKLCSILYKNKYKRFSENEYLLHKEDIEISTEYYIKPLYTDLIYGLEI